MSRSLLAFVVLVTVVGASAFARPIHYGAVDDPALIRCDHMAWRGQDGASSCYAQLLDSDAHPAVRAEAAWALNDLHAANRLFQTATQLEPGSAATLTRWGDLYADSHQDGEAMNIYREALAADSQYAFALLGAARVLVGGFDDAANVYLEPLLSNATLPAGARAGAWLLVARIALENDELADAQDNLENAAGLIDANEWPPLEVFALRAAIDLVNDVPESPWTDRALEYNPRWGNIYALPAHFYVISRRYRQAIELYQRAVDIQPELAGAHVDLGVNLLRDNQVDRARRHLETGYDRDPFSPIAVNTLRLLDSFDNFQLLQDPAIGMDSDDIPILLRLHREEAASIAPYAIELTRRSIEEFTRRYDFELREPVVIEMYPDHEDFAVRTAGMPGIPILGATFGYVVAMDSPSARPTDQFQWGTTLWHEMAHVFTLEATDHLVPRWFSEGVSVYEEWRSGPTPGVRIPTSVYAAIRDGKMLPVATLDLGFMRPSYPDQVIVSYMQAGLVCQYIDTHFGADKLSAMLDAFADGLDTAATIRRVLDVSPPEFDREFERFVSSEHGELLDNLDEWRSQHAALAELATSENWTQIAADAPHVIELHPNYVEPDSPYLILARAHDALDQRAQAMDALRTFWERGGYDPAALKTLADWLHDNGRRTDAIDALTTAAMVQPLDTGLHETLGDLLLAAGDAQGALREFRIAIDQDPHDKASAYYRLARAHQAAGQSEQSRENLLLALDVAPGYRPAQRLLLELMRDPKDSSTDNQDMERHD